MEGVELARQVAAQLHSKAVASGADPESPYAFAVAEAERRGIDVEPTAVGATLLDGGRAIFIPEDELILHENAGTPFEQAFLIAHELGHVELGDDSGSEPSRNIDPARSAEASPIGLDRVVDYGRRQRREVQMDLFAREFLLPRPLLRSLHMDDGLSATVIAERFGAPFDVVAQQLLDALLLPPIPPRADEALDAKPLNKLQAAAAGHRGEAYLLEAGPGTGKTQTLAARVEGLLEEDVDPRRILVLTFSNKAAGEMAERIARKHKDAAAAMWIGTFHAFGLDLIRRFHSELRLPGDPRLMDRTEAAELIEYEFPRLGLRHYRDLYDPTQIIANMLAAISRAKDEVVDADRYAELGESMCRRAVTDEERETAERCAEVASVYAAYEALKRRERCVDFGDLVCLPVQLLERDRAIREHLQNEYDHVLVDEYQDVNRSSVRLLQALRPDGRNLWAVGDAKQSIYRFRGASSFNMVRFGREDFPGGKRGRLELNYRSVDEIVEAFSAFSTGMRVGDAASGLTATRGTRGFPTEFLTVERDPAQTVALADTIEEMRRAGYSFRDQAVLCTGNEKLSNLGHSLERLGVPVLFLGSLFERPEVKDLLSLLSILTDRWAMGLVRIGCLLDFRMNIADVATIVNHLRATNSAPAVWLDDDQGIPGISAVGQTAVDALARALHGFDHCASPWTTLATVLLDRTRMASRLAESGDLADRVRGIATWQFMNFVRAQPAGPGLPITRLLERVRRLVRLGDDRDLRQLPAAAQGLDAVRLMTIHGAKGLEFPVTHIHGLNADTIPRKSPTPGCPAPDGMIEGGEGNALEILRAGHDEEQECLFYVALSRAQDRLFLYACTQKSNGHRRPLSPFVNRLGSNLVRRPFVPSQALPSAPETDPIPVAIEGNLRFTAPQIALYERCPRRFFYTHMLRVGGRRTATSFMQLHEAVRTVVDELIAVPGTVSDEELSRRASDAMAAHGLSDHGYRDQFQELAVAMLRFFVASRDGYRTVAPVAINLEFGEERVEVRPDDVLVRPDGGHILRRIRTGHMRSAEKDDVAAAAFVLAAQRAFPDADVQLVHLSDAEVRPIELTSRKLQTRRDKLAGFLADIRRGHFTPKVSSRTCPSCPSFFICGPTPDGVLTKKYA